jgi:threonine dehydratase
VVLSTSQAHIATADFQVSMIREARERIAGLALKTPLIHSSSLSRMTGAEVYLKMECWQACGSFKVRGVSNFLLTHGPDALGRGVITASSGNHGSALAQVARELGVAPVKVFMPEDADPVKVSKVEAAGAEAILGGENFFAAFDRAKDYQKSSGCAYVHSHADQLVIAGQGTIGLEIMEELPDVEMIVVPVGGGGLISGISAAAKSVRQEVRMVGAEPQAAPGAWLSLKQGRPVEKIDLKPSIADGLAGGLSPLPYGIAGRLIERIGLAEEDEILIAMRAFLHQEQMVVEGAACVGLAALLAGKIKAAGKKVVLVITGRNIDPVKYLKLMASDG